MVDIRARFGPSPRDELAALSTARSAEVQLGEIPELAEEGATAMTVHRSGTDVLIRRTDGAADAEAWYIHGLEGSSRNWDRLAAALSPLSTGYAVDLPGSGFAQPPSDGSYSIAHEVRWCAELIRELARGPVHLVGNSRGGYIATMIAARYPELVATLTLISPAVPDLRLFGERGASPKLALVMLPGTLGPATRMLERITPEERARGLALTCFGEPQEVDGSALQAVADEFRARASQPWAHRATVKSLRALIRAQCRPGPWSFRAAAGRVRVPTLVVWGARDRLVDARLAQRTAEMFPDHRLLVLPRTGHVAQLERPEVVARAIAALWADAADTATGHAGAPVVVSPAGMET